jgi:hypothetical protein
VVPDFGYDAIKISFSEDTGKARQAWTVASLVIGNRGMSGRGDNEEEDKDMFRVVKILMNVKVEKQQKDEVWDGMVPYHW